MLKKEHEKIVGVNWDSLSYVILCYAKMRRKITPFTILDFWDLRKRQPDIPSKLKKHFVFLTKHGFLVDSGQADYNNRYELTPKGERELFQCAQRRRISIEKRQRRNGQIGGRHRWSE